MPTQNVNDALFALFKSDASVRTLEHILRTMMFTNCSEEFVRAVIQRLFSKCNSHLYIDQGDKGARNSVYQLTLTALIPYTLIAEGELRELLNTPKPRSQQDMADWKTLIGLALCVVGDLKLVGLADELLFFVGQEMATAAAALRYLDYKPRNTDERFQIAFLLDDWNAITAMGEDALYTIEACFHGGKLMPTSNSNSPREQALNSLRRIGSDSALVVLTDLVGLGQSDALPHLRWLLEDRERTATQVARATLDTISEPLDGTEPEPDKLTADDLILIDATYPRWQWSMRRAWLVNEKARQREQAAKAEVQAEIDERQGAQLYRALQALSVNPNALPTANEYVLEQFVFALGGDNSENGVDYREKSSANGPRLSFSLYISWLLTDDERATINGDRWYWYEDSAQRCVRVADIPLFGDYDAAALTQLAAALDQMTKWHADKLAQFEQWKAMKLAQVAVSGTGTPAEQIGNVILNAFAAYQRGDLDEIPERSYRDDAIPY